MKILDPRGKKFARSKISLANREPIEKIKKQNILLYDNKKLTAKNYEIILPCLKDKLSAEGFIEIIDFEEGIRGKDQNDLEILADKFLDLNIKIAVLALADVGITPLMVHLTIALEKRGVPTVCLTAEPGHSIARSLVHYQAGKLSLVSLDIYPGKELEILKDEIEKTYPLIISNLSSDYQTKQMIDDEIYPVDQDYQNNGVFDTDMPDDISFAEQQRYIFDFFNSRKLGDGLPFITPTQELLEKMKKYCGLDEDEILIHKIGPAGNNITVYDVLVNAVMAGSKPEFIPVLITAFQAIAEPAYNINQAVTTSHPGGNTLIVSGPIVNKLGLQGKGGCLGPGFQANATIGRAINLVFLNVCRALPGISDLSCLASPGRYSTCFGEDSELAVWTTINEDYFDKETSTVTVFKADPIRNIMDLASSTAEQLLETIIDSSTNLGCNNAYLPGNIIYILTPDHGRILAAGGYSKQDIKEIIYNKVVVSAEKIKGRGIVGTRDKNTKEEYLAVSNSPNDIEIIIAGGRGGHSAVFLPWGLKSKLVVKKIQGKKQVSSLRSQLE